MPQPFSKAQKAKIIAPHTFCWWWRHVLASLGFSFGFRRVGRLANSFSRTSRPVYHSTRQNGTCIAWSLPALHQAPTPGKHAGLRISLTSTTHSSPLLPPSPPPSAGNKRSQTAQGRAGGKAVLLHASSYGNLAPLYSNAHPRWPGRHPLHPRPPLPRDHGADRVAAAQFAHSPPRNEYHQALCPIGPLELHNALPQLHSPGRLFSTVYCHR